MPGDLFGYPVILRPLSEEDGGGWMAEVPDLPGCMSDGETPEEAIGNVSDAVKGWLDCARADGDPVPSPSTLAGEATGRWLMRVPKSLHARLERQAQLEGVSLNLFAATLLAEGLGARTAHGRRSKTASVSPADAAIIKGMIERGDHHRYIAAWFGINQARVAEIANGKRFADVNEAPPSMLPPAMSQFADLLVKSGSSARSAEPETAAQEMGKVIQLIRPSVDEAA